MQTVPDERLLHSAEAVPQPVTEPRRNSPRVRRHPQHLDSVYPN